VIDFFLGYKGNWYLLKTIGSQGNQMHTTDFGHQVDQPPANKIAIHDQLPYEGELLDILLPLDDPEEKDRQEEVLKEFMKSVNHYQEAYFAYLRVKTDRAREIVGIPYYTDESGRDVELEATGWEGYFVGCRNPDGSEMNSIDIVKAIARQGLVIRESIHHIGNIYYDHPGMPSTGSMLKVAMGERFDDLEALKEVNTLYGAMLGRLRAHIGENRPVSMHEAELEHALLSYLNTGVISVTRDSDYEDDLKKYADFHQKTLSSLTGTPSITFKFDGKAIATTCILPRPSEKSPEGTNFERYPVRLIHDEREGYRLASAIGLLGNPIIRATLSLIG
jgi:hypothetical protein